MITVAKLSLSSHEGEILFQAAFEHRTAYEGGRAYRPINRDECEIADSVLAGLHQNRAYLMEPRWSDAIHLLTVTVRLSDDPFLVRDSRSLLARLRRAASDRRKTT